MPLSDAEIENWAQAFVSYQSDPGDENHPLFWAAADIMVPDDPDHAEDCWKCILRVLALDPSEDVLGMLSAGALEDLIESNGALFIDRIESEARGNPNFRRLLQGVWESSTPAVWSRVEFARDYAS